MSRFGGRVAVVTGAGRGIGRAIAGRLVGEGASVVLNDLDGDVAEAAVAELVADGGAAIASAGSVADDAVCRAIIAVAEDTFGTVDILVNNAGLTADGWLHRMTDETWNLAIDVMLNGTFQMSRAAARVMRVARGETPPHHRKVVNIASINGLYGVAGNANYSAAKAGIIGLTKSMAREWAPQRINVNAVAPGFIAGTRLTAVREDGDALGIPADTLAKIEASIPIGRGGRPEDIASAVAYLAADEADYITGQVLEVHGGREIIEVV